jgi:penicillin-binding protein 1A
MQKRNELTNEEISRYNTRFWKIVIGSVAFVAIFILSIGLGLFGPLPSFRDIEHPQSNLASAIIASDGVELGGYFVQNRSSIRYDQISPNVINALIATEDKRFYSHSGIDFRRNFTIVYYILTGRWQGASTISQQLALNLFSKEGRSRNIFKRGMQKLKEWIVAVRLEREYTKEEILAMYLNTVDWGAYNTFGIKSAANTYFSTTPDKLTPDQAAVLIGMLRAPTANSPVRNPENSLRRRNLILNQMADQGFLAEEEAELLKQKPLGLKMNRSSHFEGLAPYFREELRKDVQKALNGITKADGTPWDVYRDGLRIYTTINSKMQRYAEEAQTEYLRELQAQFNRQWRGRDPFRGLENLVDQGIRTSERYEQCQIDNKTAAQIREEFNTPVKMTIFSWRGDIDTLMKPIDSVKYYKLMLRNAMMSMEPDSGYVRAWVGGIDFEHIKYDQVRAGTRQVGSTAKPFTYAVAINSGGFSPCYQIPNQPVTFEDYGNWTPRSDHTIPGPISLRTALAHSQNYATAYMMKQVGATAVKTLTERMGITSDIDPVPSICLGVFDASLYDMVGAYSAFVNRGIWTQPIFLLRIEDKNGSLLWEHKPNIRQALDPQTAYVMTDMLKAAVREGTGRRLGGRYNLNNPIGGKTGTTQQNSDGWFIGITPQLVTGVWTGCEDRQLHFASLDMGEGANSALPVFGLYMQKVYADKTLNYSKGDFPPPPGGISISLDCSTYLPEQPPVDTDLDRLGF